MKIIECEQRSFEWQQARLGKVTGTGFAKVLNRLKGGGDSAERKAYRQQLVAERLTGQPTPCYVNEAMRWGIEHEPFARDLYSEAFHNTVEEVGFIEHDELACGVSPDGLLQDGGLLEIKCPQASTHLATIQSQTIPPDHMAQVQGSMWVSEARWCHFVSYHPAFPDHLRLFVVRVPRDENQIKILAAEVRTFLGEINWELDKLALQQMFVTL